MLELHPDCIFEMTLSANFAFVSMLVVMFSMGFYMVFVFSVLELNGEMLNAALPPPPPPSSSSPSSLSSSPFPLVHPGELLFASLRLPYFKHFLRLRVLQDGSRVDGYCIGIVDPYAAQKAVNEGKEWGSTLYSKPVLVMVVVVVVMMLKSTIIIILIMIG